MEFENEIRAFRQPPRTSLRRNDRTAPRRPSDKMSVRLLRTHAAHAFKSWTAVLAVPATGRGCAIQMQDGMMNWRIARAELNRPDEAVLD